MQCNMQIPAYIQRKKKRQWDFGDRITQVALIRHHEIQLRRANDYNADYDVWELEGYDAPTNEWAVHDSSSKVDMVAT
eukprot:8660986-Karenia_brevis.AAC.1